MKKVLLLLVALALTLSCSSGGKRPEPSGCHARYFRLSDDYVISVSPYDGKEDTLHIDRPMRNIVCMSASYLGYLGAIGKDSAVSAVSGIGYVSNPLIQKRFARGEVFDVGYEASPDYERILSLRPDVLLTYKVSEGDPPYIERLRSLGIPVLVLWEHLEAHPLARAEYVRLFGALTGERSRADSLFERVCSRYDSLAAPSPDPVKVLLNAPYAGVWYIPGEANYMSTLIRDAGGEVLGARKGEFASRGISTEEALLLSGQASYWLNTGRYDSRKELIGSNPVLSGFDIPRIFNNTKRATPGGGNDFWESGPVRPDVILEDLRKILSGQGGDDLEYYIEVR